jgi:predicted dehydrogenase
MLTNHQPLQLAFIGGAIHSAVGYTHFVASTMDHRWAVVAGSFSRDADKNSETAQKYGVEANRAYTDWRDMLRAEKQRIDAVAILLPTPLHFEVAELCMTMGIPVICEKALSINAAQSKQLLDIRNQNQAFLAVTYNYSGYPILRELRTMIENGVLGNILHFSIEMPQEGFIRVDGNGNKPHPQSWRLQDDEIPTIHLDLAVHVHELIYYLTKRKPLEVISSQSSKGWFQHIIDNVYCMCKYEDAMDGQIWFSKSALGHRNGLRLRIYGSEASAEWIQMYPEELLVSYGNGRRQVIDRASIVSVANEVRYTRFKAGHPAGFVEAFSNLYADIADTLIAYKRTGTWHSDEVFSIELALEGLYFLETMVKSSHSKKWESVPQINNS